MNAAAELYRDLLLKGATEDQISQVLVQTLDSLKDRVDSTKNPARRLIAAELVYDLEELLIGEK